MTKRIAFSENLRYYREKAGMTQMELAERIGYTGKSVSKWESGNGLPTLDTLTNISSVFEISLDALVYAKSKKCYLLGIDGGGTSTVFCLKELKGTQIRTIQLSSSNPNDVGMEKAISILKEGIKKVCQGYSYSDIVMFAGISGGGMSGDNIYHFRDFFQSFGFRCFNNGSDVENALALIPENPAILVIMGTGFIAYRIDGVKRKRIAGWGQLFDDGGSGYSIGRDCIKAALMDIDGSGKRTLLTGLLEKRLGQSADAHIPRFYEGGKQYIAGFSDLVFQAGLQGDSVACDILADNMKYVAGIVETAQKDFDKPVTVYFTGGISKQYEVLFPILRGYLSADVPLIHLEEEQIDGAVMRAKQLYQSMEDDRIG